MTNFSLFDEPPLDRTSGVAIWRQLESQLAHEIRQGVIGGEGQLPTEAALAKRFGVNRHTLRRAVAALIERGLVRVERGRGMFVEDVVIDYPLTRRTSFSANLLGQGRAPTSHMVSVKLEKADQIVAKALALRKGAIVIRREATGFADDIPITASVTYFPKRRFPTLLQHFRERRSISAALEATGLTTYRRLSTRIFARLPTSSEAASLRQPAADPVLVTEAVDVDQDGGPISFGISVFAGARVQITVEADQYSA